MGEDGGKLESRGRAALGREIETMARGLGISRAALLGHLVQAWIAWSQHGDFKDADAFEEAAGWEGDAGDLRWECHKKGIFNVFATVISEDPNELTKPAPVYFAAEWDRQFTKLFAGVVKMRRAELRGAKVERVTRCEVHASDPQLLAVELQQIPIQGPLKVAYVMSDFCEEMERLYPHIDVQRELTRARQWCVNNPKKQKTRSGVRRFLTSWMERSAESSANRKESRE